MPRLNSILPRWHPSWYPYTISTVTSSPLHSTFQHVHPHNLPRLPSSTRLDLTDALYKISTHPPVHRRCHLTVNRCTALAATQSHLHRPRSTLQVVPVDCCSVYIHLVPIQFRHCLVLDIDSPEILLQKPLFQVRAAFEPLQICPCSESRPGYRTTFSGRVQVADTEASCKKHWNWEGTYIIRYIHHSAYPCTPPPVFFASSKGPLRSCLYSPSHNIPRELQYALRGLSIPPCHHNS
ncbi:hypothetical protein F4801DRAFT_57274 [Xylaria longipes]|nr:hypothetical protein F4801DRAFT_57274 [Xylaria longipes]